MKTMTPLRKLATDAFDAGSSSPESVSAYCIEFRIPITKAYHCYSAIYYFLDHYFSSLRPSRLCSHKFFRGA